MPVTNLSSFGAFLDSMARSRQAEPLRDRSRAILGEMIGADPAAFEALKKERDGLIGQIFRIEGPPTRSSGGNGAFLEAMAKNNLKKPVEDKIKALSQQIVQSAPLDAVPLRAHRDRLHELLDIIESAPGNY